MTPGTAHLCLIDSDWTAYERIGRQELLDFVIVPAPELLSSLIREGWRKGIRRPGYHSSFYRIA